MVVKHKAKPAADIGRPGSRLRCFFSRRDSTERQVLVVSEWAGDTFHVRLFARVPGHVSLVHDCGLVATGDDVMASLRAAGCRLRTDLDIVVLLPRRHVLVRDLQLPAQAPDAIAKMIPYEAYTAAPWPREETLYSYEIVEGTAGGSTHVTLYLARLDWVEDWLARLKACNVYPTQVEVSTRGLARLLETLRPEETSVSLLLVGGGEIEYVRISPAGAPFSRAVSPEEETPAETLRRSLDIDGRAGPPGARSDLLIVTGAPEPLVEDAPADRLPARIMTLEDTVFPVANGLAPLSADLALGAGATLLPGASSATANLLPPSYLQWLEPRRLARRLRLLTVLMLWFAATVGGLAYVQYESQRARAAEARQRIEALGPDAIALEEKNAALALLAGERAQVRQPLQIVLELYEQTPRRIAINSMRLEPGRSLVLGCEAPDFPDAFAYLEVLKESRLFSDVELVTSNRSRASRDGLVEFKVKCLPQKVPAGQGGGA